MIHVGQAVRMAEEDEGDLTEPYGVGRVTEIHDNRITGRIVTVYWPQRGCELACSLNDLRPARS